MNTKNIIQTEKVYLMLSFEMQGNKHHVKMKMHGTLTTSSFNQARN